MTTTCDRSIELGAYVLHALEHDEDEEVRRHVADCHQCQDEVQEMSFTVSLLSLLTLEDLERLDVDPRAAGSVPARRRRLPRRRALLAVAAATVGILAVPAFRAFDTTDPDPSVNAIHVTDPTTRVEAAVTLARQESGTRVTLDLSGAYPSGWCALVARSRDGKTDTAATWRADASGAAHVAGMTAIPTSRLRALDVVTGAGRVLVHIPVRQDH